MCCAEARGFLEREQNVPFRFGILVLLEKSS
jgi:hypothetical protein